MTQEAIDLQSILDNPESATVEQLEALANAELNGGEAAAEADQSETAQAEGATDGAQEGKQEQEGEDAAPIASKDGKHTIPYEVLQREREQRRMAQQTMLDMQAKIDALTAQRETGEPAGESAQPGEMITKEELDALKEDFPAFAKIIEAQMAKISQMESQLSSVAGREAAREQEAAQTVAETVQETIDANPKLLHLQTNDPEGWQKAVELDELIKGKPENLNLTLAERFNKVATAYETLYGVIPAAAAPATHKQDSKPDARQLMREKLEREAPNVPRSLSDIPGGLPPEASAVERAQNMSAVEMGRMFERMTPQQQDEYLAGIV